MSHAHAHADWLMQGGNQVKLKASRISADWGKNHHSVRLANTAFEVYFCASKHLNRLLDDPKAYNRLYKAIRIARSDGWGIGVHDLIDGFRHYSDCNPKKDWSDDNTEHYNVKKSHGMFDWNVKGPECCVNFLDSMESQAKSGASSFVRLSSKMQEAKNASDGQNWGAFGAASAEIQDLEKKVKPWMFLAPDSVKNPAGSVFKYASAFHKLHTVGTTYAKLRHQRGWSIVDSLGLPLLQEAVSMLPVLGGFYSGAIGIFVNLDAELFWKKHHDRIRDRIAREVAGRF